MQYYLHVLRNFSSFSTRARRKEYWMFVLVNLGISIGLMALDNVFGLTYTGASSGPLTSLYSLVVLVPSIAVAVRRLHDINKPGWWLLVAFVPVLGALYLLYLFCQEGTRGENEYGADPKGAAAVSF